MCLICICRELTEQCRHLIMLVMLNSETESVYHILDCHRLEFGGIEAFRIGRSILAQQVFYGTPVFDEVVGYITANANFVWKSDYTNIPNPTFVKFLCRTDCTIVTSIIAIEANVYTLVWDKSRNPFCLECPRAMRASYCFNFLGKKNESVKLAFA